MDVILIPGLWLDADSWRGIAPALARAGHRAHPLTLPGIGVPAPESSEIGMADWVGAVVAEIDRIGTEGRRVALVGHSGGGNVAWGAADARPDRVAAVVFVDTVPPPDGADISEFPLVDGVVPFPGWDSFDAPDVVDLDDAVRTREAANARSVPARVPTDGIRLVDPRRHAIPVTILSGSQDEPEFRTTLAAWGPWFDEFTAIEDASVVRLGTGHWPQFSRPDRLAEAIVEALPATS